MSVFELNQCDFSVLNDVVNDEKRFRALRFRSNGVHCLKESISRNSGACFKGKIMLRLEKEKNCLITTTYLRKKKEKINTCRNAPVFVKMFCLSTKYVAYAATISKVNSSELIHFTDV